MDTYGLFKHIGTDNAYTALAKSLNSALATAETKKTLKRITREDIRYAHMGQLIIREGIAYATFIQNPGDDGEEHDSRTSGVVLAVFSVDRAMAADFDAKADVAIYPVGSRGDSCAGYVAASIFKDNSMCAVGEAIHVCFSFTAEDGISRVFRRTFDTRTRAWTDETKLMLRYGGHDYDFSDETLNVIYRDKGLLPRASGLIELVSAWSEYAGEYYATGVTIDGPNNGIVVKTRDFCTVEAVDAVPFNNMGSAEIASYVFRDRLFVACRQDYGIPYLYLGALNLKTGAWEEHHKLPDGNCRPWFFEHGGRLYLLNTTEEKDRHYTNLSRVRAWETPHEVFNRHHPVEVMATLKDCGCYFATAAHNGEIYFVATHNTESFGRLHLSFFNEDEVNRRLLALFNE